MQEERSPLIEADETGIIKRLEAANCRYYACSPRWATAKERQNSKYPIVFWLNPIQQKDNNYGWFTVEELDKWIKGTGPIPKAGRLQILIVKGKTVEADRKGT